MHSHDGARRIYEWYMNLSQEAGPDADLTRHIEQKLSTESESSKVRALKLLLAMDLGFHKRFDEAEAVYRSLLTNHAEDDPFPMILLAEQKLHYENDPVAARSIINEALDSAFRSGNFRRHALGVKARVAVRLAEYRTVEEALKQLMELRIERGNLDCGIERDFFDQLPSGVIDPHVAREFDHHARRRGASNPRTGP
jgi:hypothetical protein